MPEQITVTTPENSELRFQVAGLYSRGLAQFWDFVYQFFSAWGLSMVPLVFGFGGRTHSDLYIAYILLLYFLVFWGYYVYFEVYNDGQTPGKRKLGIRVVTVQGGRIDWSASVSRNLLRIIDFLPAFFVLGMASILFSNRHQRLGDLAAGTIVIRDAEQLPRQIGSERPNSSLQAIDA